jgi:hypothetical protein
MIQRPSIRIGLTIFLLIFTSQGLIADYITLTNKKGQNLEVKVLSIYEGNVKLQKRGDYKTYNYPLIQLNPTSQTLVQELMTPPPKHVNEPLTPKKKSRYRIDLIEKYDLERRQQGTRGTCTLFAFAHMLDYTLSNAGSNEIVSTEFLNWACRQENGRTPRDGAFFPEVREAIENYGIVIEEDFPYDPNDYDPDLNPNADLLKIAEKNLEKLNTIDYKVKCIVQTNRSTGPGLETQYIEEIIQLLGRGTPVGLGGDHCIAVFGYKGKGSEDKNGIFLILDSNGRNQKELSYKYMTEVASSAYYIEINPSAKINLLTK